MTWADFNLLRKSQEFCCDIQLHRMTAILRVGDLYKTNRGLRNQPMFSDAPKFCYANMSSAEGMMMLSATWRMQNIPQINANVNGGIHMLGKGRKPEEPSVFSIHRINCDLYAVLVGGHSHTW